MEGEETRAERERADEAVALEIARAERAAVIEAQEAALAKDRQERDDATLAARLQGKESMRTLRVTWWETRRRRGGR